MRKEGRFVFSALASLILVPAVWALPATRSSAIQQEAPPPQAQSQSVSGKIASVEKSSFTLTIGAASSNQGQQFQQSAAKTMSFMVDKNTTIDGKLKVGVTADVTYREDNGQNVAISVHVAP
jgi:hypothetical protein